MFSAQNARDLADTVNLRVALELRIKAAARLGHTSLRAYSIDLPATLLSELKKAGYSLKSTQKEQGQFAMWEISWS